MRSPRFAVATVLLAVLATGCDESLESIAGPTPTLTPTFSSIQRNIFEASDSSGRRTCVSCHSPSRGGFRRTGLDLSDAVAYNLLVGVASTEKPGVFRVAPGDPTNSYLVQKLEGRSDISGARMPISGPFLTNGQMAIIRRWIELGATRD